MNFSEKLLNLRKEKNYSQEDLADKLDVTRQSVSKWESGQTYPEMDKLIAICKIFDCSLEELTNDDIKLNDFNKESKNSYKSFLDTMLNFIKRSYYYFTHISLKELIKFIITMLVISLIVIILKYPFNALEGLINDVLGAINSTFIHNLFNSMFYLIIELIHLLLSIFLFVYIFKIGFLDKQEIIEEEEEIVNKEFTDEQIKKEPYIIKNTSSGDNKLFKFIGKIISFFVKIVLVFMEIPFVCIIVFLSFCLAIAVSLIFKKVIIIGAILGLIFSIMLVSLFIELIGDIILNKKHNAKRMIFTLLLSLIGGGISAGILALEMTNYEIIDGMPSESIIKVDSYYFKYKKGMYIDSYLGGYTSHIEDEMKDNEIKIEVANYEKLDEIYVTEDSNNNVIMVKCNAKDSIKPKDYIDLLIDGLREKKIYTTYGSYESRFTIYANRATLEKLEKNQDEKISNKIREELYNQKKNLEGKIADLEDQNRSLERANASLKEENDILQKKMNEYKERISSLID